MYKCVSGDLEKPSLCSAKPECKHECDLPEETVLPSRNTGPLPSAGQSPFGLESLFSQESIDKSVGYGALASATAHTENGFDDSKGCHVKSALENTHVSEPFSHDDISKNDDCMRTSQQDIGMEGIDITLFPLFYSTPLHNFLGFLQTYRNEVFPAI